MNRDSIKRCIESDAEKLGGTLVFRGTRVPVKNLFDYLEAGDGIEIFLDDFPTVSLDQINSFLKLHKSGVPGV